MRWQSEDGAEAPEDEWIHEKNLAQDIIADWDNGLEWVTAEAILDKRRQDGNLQYLVKWADGEEVRLVPSNDCFHSPMSHQRWTFRQCFVRDRLLLLSASISVQITPLPLPFSPMSSPIQSQPPLLPTQSTWEPEQNVEETLIRRFEDEWDRAREERRTARKAAEQNGAGVATA